jgi:UDP-2,3-diacylglucosamine pyrophosphatase LpxH
MLDAVIISDVHLGSDVCQAEILDRFLKKMADGHFHTDRLIINGDLFDGLNFSRFPQSHWKILKDLRKLSKSIEVIWISGNHDGHYENVSQLLGIECVSEYVFSSAGNKVLCLHGDKFDSFIQSYPIITKLADFVYWAMQKLDASHTLAIYAKTNSKTFLRNSQRIRSRAVTYCKDSGASIVCCGHTHHAEASVHDSVWYANSGCWTEKCCSYLTVSNGAVDVNYI